MTIPSENVAAGGIRAWAQTTGGIVGILLLVQFLTGILLAFYYVPSVDHAYTTVAYIEKVASSGSWIRSLHHYGSQWLTLFIFVHVIQLFLMTAYVNRKTQWVVAILVLGLVLAAGGTGYSLPWDARAFFSTRVAEGLLAGLPFVGRLARLWLLGGTEISTLTLSRFFALHVLLIPALIVAVVIWRLFGSSIAAFFGRQFMASRVGWSKVSRNAIVAGIVFALLAIWSLKHPAPLGPSVPEMTAEYLPRPGSQFLWLYQSLKYIPGGLGSIAGMVLPGIALLILAALPWIKPRRLVGGVILAVCVVLVVTMTSAAYLGDRRDQQTWTQLSRQVAQEEAFLREPFKPALIRLAATTDAANPDALPGNPPMMYSKLCAQCHGPRGEGARLGRVSFPPLLGVSAKPRRTVADIVALLKNPKAYGLEPPMTSFAGKLTEEQIKEIAGWVVKLK
jgi:ubiquinol-cytochrome c reductase cytochrome b subunit